MRTFLRVIAITYLVYLGLALLVITPALNYFPQRYVHDTYGRTLDTKWVLLNPFKLSLDVSEAQLSEQDGERFVSLSEASVNLSLESLWSEGWVLDTVKVHGLNVQVVQLSDDEFNFSDLLVADKPEEAILEETESSAPGVTVHELDLQSETITLADQSREKPYNSSWEKLKIHVLDLSTVLEEGRPYTVELQGGAGGILRWEGTVSIPNAHSEGHLELSNLNLRTFWSFAEPWLNFELTDGRVNAQAQYRVSWADTLSYQITGGQVGLSAIDIQPKSPEQLSETSLVLKSLQVNDIAVNSEGQQASIDTIVIDGLAVATWLEDSEISLQKLFALELPEGEVTDQEEDETASAPWSASLNKISLNGSSLRWRSPFTDPDVLNIEPIEATLEALNWPLSGASKLSLSLAANQQLQITLDGSLALDEGNGTLAYTLQELPLAWFNPNLPKALKATLTDGLLQLEGQLVLAEFAPQEIDLDGAISNFAMHREGVETNLTSWKSVRFDGLGIDMAQQHLLLETLAIGGYSGRIHIGEDGTINASNVWTADAEETPATAKAAAAQSSEEQAWSYSVPTIQLTDSEIDFMDQSLPITFRTVIADLNGQIKGISSEPGATATVDIKGAIDDYAPVLLAGSVKPSEPLGLDLKLNFDGIDMSRLSPYSGTYAGYAIDQGRLTVGLQYKLVDNQLDGENSILIDKMKLGAKVESDKAMDLPLELGLSILTDSNGIIDLTVPVTGDVDDPGFSLGGVISKAFVNILTKAITAPFSLLAGLVGSEEDLQNLTFVSGSAVVDEVNRAKLDQLSTALTQRPGLSVKITGLLNISADRERMQKNTLKAQLLADGLSKEQLDSKGPDWEKAIGKRYKKLPDTQPASDEESLPPTAIEQYTALAGDVTVSDSQMLELATQRAQAVQQYLLDKGLEEGRATLETTPIDDEIHTFSGVQLGI